LDLVVGWDEPRRDGQSQTAADHHRPMHKRESGSAAEKAKKAALDAKAQKDTEQVAFGFRFGTPS
jgi:hypothetical protein